MLVHDRVEAEGLARYAAQTSRIYSCLCLMLNHPPTAYTTDMPDRIDAIILRMADASDTEQFLMNVNDDVRRLFERIEGPNGYAIYKAWEARRQMES